MAKRLRLEDIRECLSGGYANELTLDQWGWKRIQIYLNLMEESGLNTVEVSWGDYSVRTVVNGVVLEDSNVGDRSAQRDGVYFNSLVDHTWKQTLLPFLHKALEEEFRSSDNSVGDEPLAKINGVIISYLKENEIKYWADPQRPSIEYLELSVEDELDIVRQMENEAADREAAAMAKKVAESMDKKEAAAAVKSTVAAAVKEIIREAAFSELNVGHPKKQTKADKMLDNKVPGVTLKAYQALLDQCKGWFKLCVVEKGEEGKKLIVNAVVVNGHDIASNVKDVWGGKIDVKWWDLVRTTLPAVEGKGQAILDSWVDNIPISLQRVTKPGYSLPESPFARPDDEDATVHLLGNEVYGDVA